MNSHDLLLDWTDHLDTALVRYFSAKDLSCNPLDRAMEYTVLAGGKRLRPLLTMAVVHSLGGDALEAIPVAMSSELMHTYSLIHDDLPSMDNDDFRRGKPTNHVIFGEANAILAGDALQAEAFALLANGAFARFETSRRLVAISELAEAVGRRGMVAGQVMDLTDEGRPINLERLTQLHARKTGALLRFCVRLGVHMMNAEAATLAALTVYAEKLGLMFQVVDDLLDQESSSAKLGKTAGKDAASQKATFPRLMGAAESHAFADQLLADATAALEGLSSPFEILVELATFFRTRDY